MTVLHLRQFAVMLSHMRDSKDQLLDRARQLIDTQRAAGTDLRNVLEQCIDEGLSWRQIGAGVGIPFQTLQRQYAKGGPIILQAQGGAR